MIICEEKGFALFEEGNDTPLQHIAISKGHESGKTSNDGTKAIELPKEEGSASFSIADSDKVYETRPYAKAYGIYFYGEGESIWVDLGLPSGILWAKYNVGATSPEEYGGYYAWGETEEKESYTYENYKHKEEYYYNGWWDWIFSDIGDCISNTTYDTAMLKWGNGAKMPTPQEMKELVENCYWKSGLINGIAGNFVIGPNGNSIFIPFAGYRLETHLYGLEECGYYWSGSIHQDAGGSAICLLCSNYSVTGESCARNKGISIRPVKDPDE